MLDLLNGLPIFRCPDFTGQAFQAVPHLKRTRFYYRISNLFISGLIKPGQEILPCLIRLLRVLKDYPVRSGHCDQPLKNSHIEDAERVFSPELQLFAVAVIVGNIEFQPLPVPRTK